MMAASSNRRTVALSFLLCFTFGDICAGTPYIFRGKLKGGFLGTPRHSSNVEPPPEKWLRYFVNDTFFNSTNPDAPVFLMIGGEGKANSLWMTTGTWIKYAQDFGALCLMLEHRYYGKSHPTVDMGVKHMVYLNSEQALADLAYFRSNMTNVLGLQKRKWIAFGGSYPGSLAAWFRLKYPHLVDGAVATSGPVFAKINFLEYLEVVQDALETTVPGCTEAIQTAVRGVEVNIPQSVGRALLKDIFMLCDEIDERNKNDIANLFSTLAGNFENIVQYNNDNREFEGVADANITIDTVCGMMVNETLGAPMLRYAAVNNLLLKVHNETCQDFKYDKFIKEQQNVTWPEEGGVGERPWMYQTCTEFGWYQSSDYVHHPFGHRFPINFWTQQCVDVFGPNFNMELLQRAVSRTNDDYGGFGIKVTKVVFPNGSIDPWHRMGIVERPGDESHAIFIKGTAHCANMYPASESDPKELVEAREQIKNLIAEWLTE
ncbi:PREDICTED: putative serine protease K12H4.7 isoform X2 [Priapulus caudatus]|uniref:Serine protease K12H4.7 isoform X2 n=1 Tax=Priapulus caudatus TaxID=37621 RepID=A0ABM1EL05_PRICU|nr:PREDICTED: putative serine protease K12H4.7 isoform X2 [Priapulus caudatus]